MICFLAGEEAPKYYDLHPYRTDDGTNPEAIGDVAKVRNDRATQRNVEHLREAGMNEQQIAAFLARVSDGDKQSNSGR